MKILVLAGTYPHAGHPFSGAFNEKCAIALNSLCDHVQVLAPRPYVPPGFAFLPRWRSYAAIKTYEVRNGIPIHRTASPIVPRVATPLWADIAPYMFCRRVAKKLHDRWRFDAIVSLDLKQAGGVAWRLARHLGIPASGWAFGDDVRYPPSAPSARVVARAIQNLDLVFYQSDELVEKASELLGQSRSSLLPNQLIVLPHGIPMPPVLPQPETRTRIRKELRIANDKTIVLTTMRIFREKGVFEFIDAVWMAARENPNVIGIIIGAHPAYDETNTVLKTLNQSPEINERIRLIPACEPARIWDFLSVADIFAFSSHKEGMPNSLLEAMAMKLACVAFAIPPIVELEAGTGALLLVPPLDTKLFAKAIVHLAASPVERKQIGMIAKEQVMARYMIQKNMAKALEYLQGIIQHGKKEMALAGKPPTLLKTPKQSATLR